jgi:hypothetical protein
MKQFNYLMLIFLSLGVFASCGKSPTPTVSSPTNTSPTNEPPSVKKQVCDRSQGEPKLSEIQRRITGRKHSDVIALAILVAAGKLPEVCLD